MASENPNPNVPSSESVAEVLAPLAQPETSDSAMESSSDDAVSTGSGEQRTGSCTDSPSQTKSMSYPINEPVTEDTCLTAVTLAQDDTASECSGNYLVSEGESGPTTDAPVQDESQPKKPASATESGPSASKVKPTPLAFSAGSGPPASKNMSPSACSSRKLISATESPLSSVQDTSPSEYSSKDLVSAAESEIPGDDNTDGQVSQPNSDGEPSVESRIPFKCSTLWDYIVNFIQKWQAYSLFISDSIFLVPFQVVLLALCITAIAMGYIYLYECPMALEIPVLIMTLGYVGALANCLRIAFVFYSFRSLVRRYIAVQRGIIVIVNSVFLILFSGEFYTFFSYTPDSKPDSENYCNPILYVYAYILNCVVTFLAILLSIIHLPAFLYYTFHIGGPGFPANV